MDEPRTSLAGLQKDFPFESRLSLALLIRFWEDQAKESSVRGEVARTLLTRLQDAPELTRPIDDITLLDQHSGLVDALMSAVFPSVFWEQAYMGALIPFTLRSVYGTRAMDTIMGPDGVLYGSLNLDMRALKDFRLINAYALALERLYGIHFPVDYPLILTLPDPTNGLDRHFKVQFEGRFVDVELLHPLPPLSEELRARLTAQAVDLDRLSALIPPGSIRFSGFTVVKAADVTDQEVLSSIKRDLIDKESIVSNARFVKLQAKLRTLFRRPGCGVFRESHHHFCPRDADDEQGRLARDINLRAVVANQNGRVPAIVRGILAPGTDEIKRIFKQTNRCPGKRPAVRAVHIGPEDCPRNDKRFGRDRNHDVNRMPRSQVQKLAAEGALARLADGPYTFGLRPHHVRLEAAANGSAGVPVAGRVSIAELSGSESTVHFDLDGGTWVSLSHGVHRYDVGTVARFQLEVGRGLYFAADGRRVTPGG